VHVRLLGHSFLGRSTDRLEPEMVLQVPSCALARTVSSRPVENRDVWTWPYLLPTKGRAGEARNANRKVMLYLLPCLYSLIFLRLQSFFTFRVVTVRYQPIDTAMWRTDLSKLFWRNLITTEGYVHFLHICLTHITLCCYFCWCCHVVNNLLFVVLCRFNILISMPPFLLFYFYHL